MADQIVQSTEYITSGNENLREVFLFLYTGFLIYIYIRNKPKQLSVCNIEQKL